MRSKIIITLVALLVGMVVAAIGTETAKEYKPSELQQLKLQVRQKDAQLAQVALREAQSQFQQKVKELMDESVTVKKEQGWPESVQFNPDQLSFSEPPPVAKPPAKEPK